MQGYGAGGRRDMRAALSVGVFLLVEGHEHGFYSGGEGFGGIAVFKEDSGGGVVKVEGFEPQFCGWEVGVGDGVRLRGFRL